MVDIFHYPFPLYRLFFCPANRVWGQLEKYFGKDKTPREMKDTILALLDEWKEKQPPELGKGEKKKEMEK